MSPRDYEDLLARLYGELSGASGAVRVFLRRTFAGHSGQSYVIDLGYEFELLGAAYLTVIEAKHYSNAVEVGEVLEFVAKLDDIKAHKGIMITTRGFQRGAQKIAASNRVALMVYRPGDHDRPEAILQREGDDMAAAAPETDAAVMFARSIRQEMIAAVTGGGEKP
jgi:Restriction endonuclease